MDNGNPSSVIHSELYIQNYEFDIHITLNIHK